jgi:hypothetical protein
MLRIIAVLFISINFSFAIKNIEPTYSLYASGDVQDIVYSDSTLYAATSEGIVDIFDIKTKKLLSKIAVPPIKDFMGDEVPAKLYSIDKLNEKILFVSQGMKGYRNLWIYENSKLTKLLDIDKKLFIKKAKFVSEDKVLLATLSNEIFLLDVKNKKYIYTIQISSSSFSDFVLDEEKKHFIATDESGIVRLLDVMSGNILKIIGKKNLDRVYQLDYKNKIVLTAGQDRKAVVYNKNNVSDLDFHFLLYSCGLSPKGNLGAIAYNENNDVLVFKTNDLSKLYNLTKNKATLTKILFISNKELFATSDSSKINYWRLP